jgi:hypothetical protein
VKFKPSGHVYVSLQEKLDTNKKVSGDCLLWTGSLNRDGYGQVRNGKKMLLAHRASYCLHHKIDPVNLKGLILHKPICPNKNCINPIHLYVGDYKQNATDTMTVGHHSQKSKTHCPRGHEYSEENTRYHGQNKEKRDCKICARLLAKATKLKRLKALGISDIEAQVLDL